MRLRMDSWESVRAALVRAMLKFGGDVSGEVSLFSFQLGRM